MKGRKGIRRLPSKAAGTPIWDSRRGPVKVIYVDGVKQYVSLKLYKGQQAEA